MNGPTKEQIPDPVMRRLSYYLRALTSGSMAGHATVSSQRLAQSAGTTPATLRKDLNLLRVTGRAGIGYAVGDLVPALESALGLDQQWRVAIVGAGHLGTALAGYSGFQRRGYPVVAIFDKSPKVVGSDVAGLTVEGMGSLESVIQRQEVNMAVLTVPGAAAQEVLDRLVGANVRSILSFSPVALHVPDGVSLRRVDLASELSLLAHRSGPVPH
ncbi:MAG: redox-sensing transcriptional repressor Rex [Galactobacter sp.]